MSDKKNKERTTTRSKSRIPFAKTGRRIRKLFSLRAVSARLKTRSSIDEYEKKFRITDSKAVELVQDFEGQLKRGLQEDSGSSLKMMPSWITNLPDGSEKGDFYAIDIGGTFLRLLYCKLSKTQNHIEVNDRREIKIPENRKYGPIQNLFDFVVASFKIYLDVTGNGVGEDTMQIGFCLSFPLKMERVDVGSITQLTKGYDYDDAIGKDAVEMLKRTFIKSELNVKIRVICNDSLAVLAAGRYQDRGTEIGVVLGTGTNAACVEPVKDISKWSPGLDGDLLSAVNTEWGDFMSEALPRTDEDLILDQGSQHPGQQIFEKMICGQHLGELCRILISNLHASGKIFKDNEIPNLALAYSLTSPAVCDITLDTSFKTATKTMERIFGTKPSQDDAQKIKTVCDLVVNRAGLLFACALAATIRHVRKGPKTRTPVIVAIDGSTYLKFDKFQQIINDETKRMLKLSFGRDRPKFKIVPCEGGSCLGAAILAAANRRKSRHGIA